jgi:arylsulfatase A-like enzyme
VPLIIRAPWMTKSTGQRSTIMAELVDVFPTIVALAGAPPPTDDLDGVSLGPVFEDPQVTVRITCAHAPQDAFRIEKFHACINV